MSDTHQNYMDSQPTIDSHQDFVSEEPTHACLDRPPDTPNTCVSASVTPSTVSCPNSVEQQRPAVHPCGLSPKEERQTTSMCDDAESAYTLCTSAEHITAERNHIEDIAQNVIQNSNTADPEIARSTADDLVTCVKENAADREHCQPDCQPDHQPYRQPEHCQLIKYDTLVLSSGSTKGFSMLGAMQYAYDHYLIDARTYVGTSAGAMICYFLAIGYTPIEILVYLCTHEIMENPHDFNLFGLLKGKGALSFARIQEHLERMTIDKIGYLPTLADIKARFGKHLIITTHNLTENRVEYLSAETHPTLPCLTALHMSANIPFVFDLYRYGQCFYIDGGVSDGFPIDVGDRIGQRVLGIYVDSAVNYDEPTAQYNIDYVLKLLYVPIMQILRMKVQAVSSRTRVVRLACSNVKFFEFSIPVKDRLRMFSSGYEQMRAQNE